MRVAIIGWSEGNAGQVDEWYRNSNDTEVKMFVSLDNLPLKVDPSHIQRRSTKFSYPELTSGGSLTFKGRRLIIDPDWVKNFGSYEIDGVIICLDDAQSRLIQIKNAETNGIKFARAHHQTAYLDPSAECHDSAILFPRVFVGYKAEIGKGVVINTNSQIDHHNVICDGVTIDPGCIFAGNVTCEELAHIHTGVVIKNRITVGLRSRVGAGSVVIRDVQKDTTVVGVPAAQI